MSIFRPIFYFFANLAALLIANHFVDGFWLNLELSSLLSVAFIFTILNTYFRPLVKYAFTTFIIFSFGIFTLVINAATLYILDFITENISINGLTALWYSTLIVTVTNILISLIGGLFKKNNL